MLAGSRAWPYLALVAGAVYVDFGGREAAKILSNAGIRSELVGNGQEAVDHLRNHPVDLVLSDHKMPGTTGLQFLDEVARRRPTAVRMLITG